MTLLAATTPADESAEAAARRAAFAAARGICRREARGLYSAVALLPRRKRDASYAVLAFSRMVDEAIDVPAERFVGASVRRDHPVVSLKQVERPNPDACEHGDSLENRLALLR